MKKYRLAVVGATGLVGRMMLQVLSEKKLPIKKYYLFASSNSAGKIMEFMGKSHKILELNEDNIKKIKSDFALFAVNDDISDKFASLFVLGGTTVIDNSCRWRMEENVPLVVPEVNFDTVKSSKLISNPNCSTIQAVCALAPLNEKFEIKRVVLSTYQAVSGAGRAGLLDLENTAKGENPKKFPHAIFDNVLPHIGAVMPCGCTKEEVKMICETRKILNCPKLKITATTARVPIKNCHSISINVQFKKPCSPEQAREVLRHSEGIVVLDEPENNIYPLPEIANGRDEVYVGRIRKDFSVKYGINLWVVADNLRKGAATNAAQILERLLR